MFTMINYGLIKCDNGVEIRIHREHISYIKDGRSIGVGIERLVDHTVVIYINSLAWQNPSIKDTIGPDLKKEVLKTIQEVLSFMNLKYEMEEG